MSVINSTACLPCERRSYVLACHKGMIYEGKRSLRARYPVDYVVLRPLSKVLRLE